MAENLLCQLPKPPELEPLPSVRTKVWQVISLVLIVAGLGLVGWASWLFHQRQFEVNQPPPARILEMSEADLYELDTLHPEGVVSEAIPTLETTAGQEVTVIPGQAIEKFSYATNNGPLVIDVKLDESAQPHADISAAVVGTAPDTASSQEPGPALQPVAQPHPSLAENPLPVIEPERVPQPDEEAAAVTTKLPAVPPASSPPTRIVVESIDLETDVIAVGWKQISQNGQTANVWEVADYAAGWHKNSMLPGQGGNIVLSGHNNIKGEVFRYLEDLEPGDTVTLYAGDQPYEYTVADKFILKDKGEPEAIRRANARWIGPFNEERLTLVTCWPYTNNTHRLIVIAKPVGQVQTITTPTDQMGGVKP